MATTPPPPPSYQLSQEDFDQKTARALQLSASHTYLVDQDGWQIYNPTAFEAAAECSDHPPASSSAGILGARHQRQGRPQLVNVLPLPHSMKTRSSERYRRNPQPDDVFSSEPRLATPPPPFTATGPSLDGPPFEQAVRLSYNGPDSQAASPLEPCPPPLRSPPPQVLRPVEPLRPHRRSDSHLPTSMPSGVYPRPSHASTTTRVEFDHRWAYSPYGGLDNHTSTQNATAFYNHAVASQLATGPAITTSTQPGHTERVSSPYSSGSPQTTYRAQHAVSSASLQEQYASQPQNFRFSTPAAPPPLLPPSHSTSPSGAGYGRGTARGPLPPVPASNLPLPHSRWGGSDAQLVQDVYGGHG